MASAASAPAAASAYAQNDAASPKINTPVCLVLGMAGSGKTTLVDALASWLEDEDDILAAMNSDPDAELESSKPDPPVSQPTDDGPIGAYVVNLDPAVHTLPYDPNIDIRDTLRYKEVMKEYSLGPNGAIITSLNLYATRFDQVLSLVERRAPEVRAVLFDTPGQIETFTWSASGSIITDALAMALPTVVLFVIDTERSQSAMTFVSNMLYACSVMYKTGLPMIVVFNKVDVVSCKFAQAWMQDFDTFDSALKDENFVGTLARSMAMALEEFYKNMRSVGVSARTGEGLPQLAKAIQAATEEYEKEYRPVLEEKKRIRAKEEEERKGREMEKLDKDLKEERDTKWAPRDAQDSHDTDSDAEAQPEETVRDPRLERLRQKGPSEEEDKEAYENFVKYLGALDTKDKAG